MDQARGGEEASCRAHNPETQVQALPPQPFDPVFTERFACAAVALAEYQDWCITHAIPMNDPAGMMATRIAKAILARPKC